MFPAVPQKGAALSTFASAVRSRPVSANAYLLSAWRAMALPYVLKDDTRFLVSALPQFGLASTPSGCGRMSEKPIDQVRARRAMPTNAPAKPRKRVPLSNEIRDDYLRLQGYWLNLADSYEFADRVLNSTNEHDRERRDFLKGKQ